MSKHTPGPWTKAERLHGPWWHISAETSGLVPGQGRQAVACVHGESKRGAKAYAEMFEANAHLIAAAPELLVALELAREALLIWAPKDIRMAQIDHAISKARGELFNTTDDRR